MFSPKNYAVAWWVAIVIVVVWALWLVTIALLIAGNLFYDEVGKLVDSYLVYLIGAVSGLSVFAFIAMIFPICPRCGSRIFNEPKEKHPNFFASKWLGGWAGVVVSILRDGQFVCMHCGSKIDFKG